MKRSRSTLQATMPDGVVVERVVARPGAYRFATAQKRMNQWILLSMHSSQTLAERSKSRLERCFSYENGSHEFQPIAVVPLVRKSASQFGAGKIDTSSDT